MNKFLHVLAIALLVLAAAMAFSFAIFPGRPTLLSGRAGAISITLVASPEVRPLLGELKEAFAVSEGRLPDGTAIQIEVIPDITVNAARRLVSNDLAADAWLANSPAWVEFVRDRKPSFKTPVSQCNSVFNTPFIFAIPSHQSSRFTAKQKATLTWASLRKLLQTTPSPQKAARWHLVHGTPGQSALGLEALSFLVRLETLVLRKTPVDRTLLAAVQRLELSALNYGQSETLLLEQVAKSLETYPVIAVTTEQQLETFLHLQLESKRLTSISPADGSTLLDYQICIPEPGALEEKKTVALNRFVEYLLSPAAHSIIKSRGFRVPGEVSHKNKIVTLPEVYASDQLELLTRWPHLRRPVAIAYLIDSSSSMRGELLLKTKALVRDLVARSSRRDQSAILSFSTSPRIELDFNSDPAIVTRALDHIQTAGGASYRDAIALTLQLLRRTDKALYRKIILVITDGQDRSSELSHRELMEKLSALQRHDAVSLVILAIEGDSDLRDLEQLALAAGGIFRPIRRSEIQNVALELYKGF